MVHVHRGIAYYAYILLKITENIKMPRVTYSDASQKHTKTILRDVYRLAAFFSISFTKLGGNMRFEASIIASDY